MNKHIIFITIFLAAIANVHASQEAIVTSNAAICAQLRHIELNPADRSTALALIDRTALSLGGLQLYTTPDMLEQMTISNVPHPSRTKAISPENIIPISLRRLTNLAHLDLNHNRLSGLPTFLFKLTNLRELYCENNYMNDDGNVRAIPEGICNLTRLEELSLAQNKIHLLPFNIGFLQNLVVLDISGNAIANLPASIARLISLKQLFAAGNQLSSLPNTFGQINKLEYLDLSENKFKDFPGPVLELKRIQGLYMMFNEITSIPTSIYKLSTLLVLNIYNNKLQSIPDQMAQMTTLRLLDIRNNTFDSIPFNVLELGRDVVRHNCTFNLLFDRIEGHSDYPLFRLHSSSYIVETGAEKKPKTKTSRSMYTYNSSYENDDMEMALEQASMEELEEVYHEAMALAELAKKLMLTRFGQHLGK